MRQCTYRLTVQTRGKGLTDITQSVGAWLADQAIATGVMTLFCRHTSASLLIQENADPGVLSDLAAFFERVAPESGAYVHRSEGADDMPAHIRTALTQSSLSIPVEGGAPVLGTWQGLYLFEHRLAPRTREIRLHVIGE